MDPERTATTIPRPSRNPGHCYLPIVLIQSLTAYITYERRLVQNVTGDGISGMTSRNTSALLVCKERGTSPPEAIKLDSCRVRPSRCGLLFLDPRTATSHLRSGPARCPIADASYILSNFAHLSHNRCSVMVPLSWPGKTAM